MRQVCAKFDTKSLNWCYILIHVHFKGVVTTFRSLFDHLACNMHPKIDKKNQTQTGIGSLARVGQKSNTDGTRESSPSWKKTKIKLGRVSGV